MLTLEELRSSNVDFDIAKEALAQSEKRLGDALDAKKAVEQKATVLFGAYVTIMLALFGAGAALAKDAHLMAPALPFFVTGTIFLIGALSFANVFKGAEYGNLGSEPSMWLQSGRIDGDKQAFARMLAYLAHHHANRISVSYASNDRKTASLHFGMVMGIVGGLVLLLTIVVIYGGPATIHP
jgi:hypothetical protein